MLDHITGGRAYVGFARGYQDRWVNTLAQGHGVGATLSDKSEVDLRNRQAFEEAWEIIKLAWTEDTFSYDGQFWKVPPPGTTWDMPATHNWGRGAQPGGALTELGITPKPLPKAHPPVYSPFTFSATTSRFWAREGGTPVSNRRRRRILPDPLPCVPGRGPAGRPGTRVRPGYGHGRRPVPGRDAEQQAREMREQFDWLFQAWFVPIRVSSRVGVSKEPRTR